MIPGDPLDAARTRADWRMFVTDTISIRAGHLNVRGARMVERLIVEWCEANPAEATELAHALKESPR